VFSTAVFAANYAAMAFLTSPKGLHGLVCKRPLVDGFQGENSDTMGCGRNKLSGVQDTLVLHTIALGIISFTQFEQELSEYFIDSNNYAVL